VRGVVGGCGRLAVAGVPGGARAHAHEGFGEDAISDYPLGFRRKLAGPPLTSTGPAL
jgi:hypothetical protein